MDRREARAGVALQRTQALTPARTVRAVTMMRDMTELSEFPRRTVDARDFG
jgi:hypothetical protein